MAFLRRLLFAPVVLVAVAAVTYGVPRILRPDRYPGQHLSWGLWHDLDRVFLHLDFGCAVMLRGCPSIHDLWVNGLAWDLWLLGGGVVLGTAGGILAGVWCARRPRALRARALEAAAMTAYCAPVFFVGLFALYLFNPIYGRVPLPFFFDAEPKWVQPWNAPWDWFRAMLVPCLVLAAPIGAMCLRLPGGARRGLPGRRPGAGLRAAVRAGSVGRRAADRARPDRRRDRVAAGPARAHVIRAGVVVVP